MAGLSKRNETFVVKHFKKPCQVSTGQNKIKTKECFVLLSREQCDYMVILQRRRMHSVASPTNVDATLVDGNRKELVVPKANDVQKVDSLNRNEKSQIYRLLNGEAKKYLLSSTHKNLMEMGQGSDFDSKFINTLLNAFFTKEELKNGSYGGGVSNCTKTFHDALDSSKLNLIKRMCYTFRSQSPKIAEIITIQKSIREHHFSDIITMHRMEFFN